MKKLLILAYDFPPYVSVGGLRPYNWYKNLKQYNIEPIVVTRQWQNHYKDERDYIAPSAMKETQIEATKFGTILYAPHFPNWANKLYLKNGKNKFVLIRRIISAFYEYAQYFTKYGTKRQLYKVADEYLKENKVDCIIATGEPFVLLHYANKLSQKHKVKWIADYRDTWSQNEGRQQHLIISGWNKFIERKTIKSAAAITTVSEFLRKKIEQNSPNIPFHILPNGYDEEAIAKIKDLEQGHDKLSIAFVGRIYEWHPWASVLDTLSKWMITKPNARVELNFYGVNKADEIEDYVKKNHPQLSKLVVIHSKMPNSELLVHLAHSNVMLLFNYYSYMGTKIYDYLGVKRKILLCYENDPDANRLKDNFYGVEKIEGLSERLQAELIENTYSGTVVRDKDHLFTLFGELWSEFVDTGQIECSSLHVENYSRKIQAQKLSDIIKAL